MQQSYQGDSTVSVGEWFVSFLIMFVPIVNIVMIFVWAFGANTKPSKANFFKFSLILTLIGIVLSAILYFAGALTLDLFTDYM